MTKLTPKCPYCGSEETYIRRHRKLAGGNEKPRYQCRKCSRTFSEDEQKEQTTFEQGDDYINVVCSTRRLKTVEDVIEHYGIDTDIWKVDKFQVKTDEAWRKDREVEWVVGNGNVSHGRVRDSGKILLVPITRIHVRFIRRPLNDIQESDIQRLFKEIQQYKSQPITTKKKYSLSGCALEINIADLHNGRMTIAENAMPSEDKMKLIIDDILARAKGKKFSVIYLALLGDIVDIDTMKMTTTGGTQQYTTMTPYSLVRNTTIMVIDAVERLRKLSPVKYIFVPGNHDELISFAVANAVHERYHKANDVTVELSEEHHKWDTFGVNLIAWTHGNISKENMFSWLPVKARKVWSSIKYAEIHSGHINDQKVYERGGQVVRYLPSPSDVSLWEEGRG